MPEIRPADAAPPGSVTLTAEDDEGNQISLTETYDPDTGALADPAFTTSGPSTSQAIITITCANDDAGNPGPVYTISVPAGMSIAAADLATLTDATGTPITSDTQFDGNGGGLAFSAE